MKSAPKMPNGQRGGFDEWSLPQEEVFSKFKTSGQGLGEADAAAIFEVGGPNELVEKKRRNIVLLFLSYFFNPLIIFLVIIGALSYIFSSAISGIIIYAMVIVSVALTFRGEYIAQNAAEKLRRMIRSKAKVVREGKEKEVPLRSLVPGDIVKLVAGDMVPADCYVISCKDFFVNQASLTGESLPVEKQTEPSKKGASITELLNAAFFGSSVVSGSAEAVVIRTGAGTQFGDLAQRLSQTGTETAFDRGIRDYSFLMLKFIFVLVIILFAINALLKEAETFQLRIINAFLFALAVAVGLTPEMLPVIVTANLSQGAKNMSKKEVIVKRLSSIQNFGAMDILCTDKTGTLTEDKIALVRHVNADGEEDEVALKLAYLNSFHQTGLKNPLDKAILDHDAEQAAKQIVDYEKIDEIPFDFARRRMSVVVQEKGKKPIMLSKGAPEGIFALCIRHATHGIQHPFDKEDLERAEKIYDQLSSEGFRVLALASKKVERRSSYSVNDESEMTFEGFLAFLDPPKATAKASLAELAKRGVQVKILSGDNELVNRKIAKEVGLEITGVLTGEEIENASEEALRILVERNNVFARVLPVQKERIIIALQKNRHVVGFMGDGINDSLALKTSDVGISVDSAVDVARESADIILLHKSLHVLYEGVDEGRRTFANSMKYIRMGSSSNFGNMFSVLGASLFLPFLPMQPIQIIFNNFLYDMSQVGIPSDTVDDEALLKPAQWDMRNVRNFMIYIGPVSSLFDYLTFFALFLFIPVILATAVPVGSFQAGWFIESIITQTLVVYVIRTNKIPFVQSWPSRRLMMTTLGILVVAAVTVLTPIGGFLGFSPLPLAFFPILAAYVVVYLLLTQFIKTLLLKRGVIA